MTRFMERRARRAILFFAAILLAVIAAKSVAAQGEPLAALTQNAIRCAIETGGFYVRNLHILTTQVVSTAITACRHEIQPLAEFLIEAEAKRYPHLPPRKLEIEQYTNQMIETEYLKIVTEDRRRLIELRDKPAGPR